MAIKPWTIKFIKKIFIKYLIMTKSQLRSKERKAFSSLSLSFASEFSFQAIEITVECSNKLPT